MTALKKKSTYTKLHRSLLIKKLIEFTLRSNAQRVLHSIDTHVLASMMTTAQNSTVNQQMIR